MTAVRTTLNHSIGEDFSVKVTATNGKGTSELSTQSNTIAAQDVPQGKVTIDSNFTTTTSSVSISWTALTQNSDTGYSDITTIRLLILTQVQLPILEVLPHHRLPLLLLVI